MDKELIDEEKLEEEINRQRDYANSIFGLVSFTFALAAMAMSNPQKIAILCLFFLFPMIIRVAKYYPPELRALRDLAEETNDPKVRELYNKLQKKSHGIGSVFNHNLMYISGLTLIATVAFFPEFTNFMNS